MMNAPYMEYPCLKIVLRSEYPSLKIALRGKLELGSDSYRFQHTKLRTSTTF